MASRGKKPSSTAGQTESALATFSAPPAPSPGDMPARQARFFRSYAQNLLICLLLIASVFVVFGQTVRHGFVNLDDDEYVYENRHVLEGLSAEGIAWAFTHTDAGAYWHPLTVISLMADVQLLKSANRPLDLARLAGRMHLVNVALHAANTLLLFLLMRGMTNTVWRSAMVAALFSVHPLHVESVAWITERKDVLSGLFGMLALIAYVRYAQRPSLLRALCTLVTLALGLMCKPMLVTWPLLFLLLDFWPLERVIRQKRHVVVPCPPSSPSEPNDTASGEVVSAENREGETIVKKETNGILDERVESEYGAEYNDFEAEREKPVPRRLTALILEKLPLLLLVAAFAMATYRAQQSSGAVATLQSVPIFARIARASVIYVGYLGKTLWPSNLAAAYPSEALASRWQIAGAAATFLILTAVAVWGARSGKPWLAVGWLWFLVTLVPTIGLVQVGSEVMADRFLYLPQIGLCVAAVWFLADVAAPLAYGSLVCSIAATIVLPALAVCAAGQTAFWRDDIALWTRTLDCTTDNYIARLHLGLALSARGQTDKAMPQYEEAIRIRPDFAEARFNLGCHLEVLGRGDAAQYQYETLLRYRPGYVKARNNLGMLLLNRGNPAAAAEQLRYALKVDPHFALAQNNLGLALMALGQNATAAECFRRAIELDPDFATPHANLGLLLQRMGQSAEAAAELRCFLRAQPENSAALGWLAWVLATPKDDALRDGPQAVELARKAAALTRDSDPDVLDALATAYASVGQFPEAVKTAAAARDLFKAAGQSDRAADVERRIDLYRSGRPFHE
jgi:tetratricopeptide (TPR) repeat protein